MKDKKKKSSVSQCLCSFRCNISYLEEWLKEKELQSFSVIDTLRPLSQAAWLLQVNKSTDEDAKEITDKCTELNSVQVLYSVACSTFDLENFGITAE